MERSVVGKLGVRQMVDRERPAGRRRPLRRVGPAAGLVVAALLAPGLTFPAQTSSQQRSPLRAQHVVAGDPVIAAAGDIACPPPNKPNSPGGDPRCMHFATADLVDAIKPTAVLPLGDIQNNWGTIEEFMGNGGYNDTWGRFNSIAKPVIGQNEYEDPKVRGRGYFDYWNGIGRDTRPGMAGESGRGYYSYDLGAWHLIALNSELPYFEDPAVASAQVEWLRADLAAPQNKDRCTLAYWHRPLFSTGSSGSGKVEPLAQALYEAKADILLVGHAHRYERYAPQSPKRAADPNGLRQFIVGTGGHAINPIGDQKVNLEKAATGYGVLKMTLHADSYDWEFVPAPGTNIADSGTSLCVGSAAAPASRR